jgi:hypothetical protein
VAGLDVGGDGSKASDEENVHPFVVARSTGFVLEEAVIERRHVTVARSC